MLYFLMGVLCPARTHKVITPAAVLSAAYVPSMHGFGRTVQLKVAISHMWTCHCIEQELKVPTAHSRLGCLGGWEAVSC